MSPPNDAPADRFVSLVEAHKGILYKVAGAYCRDRDDRGDLIQEIVVQLWRSFDRWDERAGRFSTWMYRVAMNVAISAHRSERRRAHDTVPIDAVDLAAADAVMSEASDDVRLLQRLVAGLGDIDRALVLLYLDGHTHDEIGEVLGITATNASTRIARIKERLARDFDAAKEKEK